MTDRLAELERRQAQLEADLAELRRQLPLRHLEPAPTEGKPLGDFRRRHLVEQRENRRAERQALRRERLARRRRRRLRWRTAREIWGLPLCEIACGPDPLLGERHGHAQAIFAVGDRADGVVAIGGIARGGLAIGGLSFGLFSVGGLAGGLLASLGGVALAPFVVGGIAVGGAAMGGVAVGFRAHGPSAVGLQVSHPETRLHSGRGPQAASPKPEPPWGGPKQSESSLKSPPLHPSQTVPGPVPLSGAP